MWPGVGVIYATCFWVAPDIACAVGVLLPRLRVSPQLPEVFLIIFKNGFSPECN